MATVSTTSLRASFALIFIVLLLWDLGFSCAAHPSQVSLPKATRIPKLEAHTAVHRKDRFALKNKDKLSLKQFRPAQDSRPEPYRTQTKTRAPNLYVRW